MRPNDPTPYPRQKQAVGDRVACRGSMRGMNKFDLRPVEGGVELRGGQLEEPMVFREADGEQRAIKLAGVSVATSGRPSAHSR